MLEIHRLAMLGEEADIARDVAGRLAGSWLGFSRFRDVRDLCIASLELGPDADLLNYLGRAERVLGEVDEAMRHHFEALKMREEGGDRAGECVTRYNMAGIYRDLDRLREAVEELKKVVELNELVQHPDMESDRAMLAQVQEELRAS